VQKGIPIKNIYQEVESVANSLTDLLVLKNLVENVLKKDHLLIITKIDRYSRNTILYLSLRQNLFKFKKSVYIEHRPFETRVTL